FIGEVAGVDALQRERVLQILSQNGVEWEVADHPPAVVEVTESGGGVLESLSLFLTGSLLHYSFMKPNSSSTSVSSSESIKQLCYVEHDELFEIHEFYTLRRSKAGRPQKLSSPDKQFCVRAITSGKLETATQVTSKFRDVRSPRTFLPREEEHGHEDWRGILLFADMDKQPMRIIPIVPSYMEGDIWIRTEKLPPVYGEGQVLSSLTKLSFRGRMDVLWFDHTATGGTNQAIFQSQLGTTQQWVDDMFAGIALLFAGVVGSDFISVHEATKARRSHFVWVFRKKECIVC
ncbi:unnamed protein product, partial [Darwinula stevensoni]